MEFFVIKTSCRFQQHIYHEQSILRYISSLEPRMLLSGNSILLFFIKLLKNLENQTQISSLLKLISNWIDMCLGIQNQKQWLSLPSLLLGSLVSWILVKIHRDKTNAVIAVPEWSTQYSAYPAVATDDQPGPTVFSWDKHVGLNKDHLIITLKKPFKGVSIDTMRSWVKNIFILNSCFFFLISAGQPQRVKQRTWRSTLMRYSNQIVGKIGKTFSSFMIKSLLNMLQMT